MREVVLCLMMSTLAAWISGCADTNACPDGQTLVDVTCRPTNLYGPITKKISMGCFVAPRFESLAPANVPCCIQYELTVALIEPIVAGEEFGVDFEGKVTFDESAIALVQESSLGGFTTLEIQGVQATVHVREGATGDDVVLTPEADVPFSVDVPLSTECATGGFCERQGHERQCVEHDFCVEGPVEILVKGSGGFRADPSGTVLFGFAADGGDNVEVLDDGSCNEGTYYFPEAPSVDDPIGPNGVRMRLRSPSGLALEMGLECVMGEQSRGSFGIDSCDPETSPTPDSRLIRFPIQQPEE
jgi:hypothetical protein